MTKRLIKTIFAAFIVGIFAAAIFAQKTDLKVITETTKITAEELKSLAAPIDKSPC